MKSLPILLALCVLLTLSAFSHGVAPATFAMSTLDRPADPVVVTGSDIPSLVGIAPGDLVAFRYEGGWQQIPVQVDERDTKYFEDIYQNSEPWPGTSITGVSELVYVDSGTFTGPIRTLRSMPTTRSSSWQRTRAACLHHSRSQGE